MSFLFRKAAEMPSAETALPGRDTPIPVVARHPVLDTPIVPPFPEGLDRIVVGMGCFWGAGRPFLIRQSSPASMAPDPPFPPSEP